VEGVFPEAGISEVPSFWPDEFVRLAGEKRLRLTDLGWHAQHRRATLCVYVTPSCFLAGAFPGYSYVEHQHAVRCLSCPDQPQAEAG
jgi:hypothetical protein